MSKRQLVTVDLDVLRRELKTVIKEAIAKEGVKPAQRQLFIPLTIFQDAKLGVLESIVKYLKDEKQMSYIEMSKILGRDNKVLWRCYSNAKKKSKKTFRDQQMVHIKHFIHPKLTCFEAITLNLKKEYGYSLKKIAQVMGRNYQTVWATYNRAVKKL